MYFNENLTYPKSYFCRCFRMSIKFFKHIAMEVMKFNRFFEQQRNSTREIGHITNQKVTTALRMLAYGIPTYLIDANLVMGESTAIMCVKRFAVAIVHMFSSTYLRPQC
jgi:hypothetical protein